MKRCLSIVVLALLAFAHLILAQTGTALEPRSPDRRPARRSIVFL